MPILVKNALEADEVTRFTALQEKRYANLSKSDAAMLKLYESDYNKAPADKLIYDATYIWDGGYCPTADDGSTTNTVLGAEPTTKVGLGNHADIPVYAGWGVLPKIDSTEEKPYVVIGTNEVTYQGATSTKDNTFYYVNLATLEEGVYDSIPTGVYFKYNDKYYQATADIQGFGSWQLDKAQEITDADVIAELTAKGPNEYPAPAAVTDFALNTTTLNLDVKVRGEGSFKDTVISYDSAYIALGGVTPANNADMDKVTVEYSIVNGGDYITLGTPSTTNPYAVKVTANQNIASDATAQVACTFKYDGTELGTKYVTVNVTRTIQNQTYNAQYGLYCRGLAGELGNNSTELRLGNTASVGQWATWMSFINDGRTFSGPVEGLRRFTGYVYLSENEFRSGNTLYFSALDDILIAGDDSFSIVVNGVPFFRADISLAQ